MNHAHRFAPLALACAAVLCAPDAGAAARTDLHGLDVAAKAAAATANVGAEHARHARMLGLDADSRLLLVARKSSLGVRSHRYVQTFRGLPVFGEGIVVGEDAAGNLRPCSGRRSTAWPRRSPPDGRGCPQAARCRSRRAPASATASASCAPATRPRR